jgi:Zn-dependent M32 family carboxypeptidase
MDVNIVRKLISENAIMYSGKITFVSTDHCVPGAIFEIKEEFARDVFVDFNNENIFVSKLDCFVHTIREEIKRLAKNINDICRQSTSDDFAREHWNSSHSSGAIIALCKLMENDYERWS